MLVHALIASVRTRPEPAVFAVFDRVDEVFAYFVGGGLGVAVFAQDDFAEFGCRIVSALLYPSNTLSVTSQEPESKAETVNTFIPINHIILLPLFLFPLLLRIPTILIQIPLLAFPLHRQIVAELAFSPLFAIALLVVLTQYRLRIDAKRHFLDLHRLEEIGGFTFGLFRRGFFLFALSFFGVFAFLFGGLGRGGLGFDGLDLFLGLGSFFLEGKY